MLTTADVPPPEAGLLEIAPVHAEPRHWVIELVGNSGTALACMGAFALLIDYGRIGEPAFIVGMGCVFVAAVLDGLRRAIV